MDRLDVLTHCTTCHQEVRLTHYDVVLQPWVECPGSTTATPHEVKPGQLARAR